MARNVTVHSDTSNYEKLKKQMNRITANFSSFILLSCHTLGFNAKTQKLEPLSTA